MDAAASPINKAAARSRRISAGRSDMGRRRAVALLRVAAAEATGTMLLVLLGGLAPPLEGAARAAAAGVLVAALVQCFVLASGGQFNPCVTLAALVWGRADWRRAGTEWVAQLVGAVVGAGALRIARGWPAGVVQPACGPGAAVLLEGVGGAVLALANCAAWDARAPPPGSWPLRIGATVGALTLATHESGASLNPARSFGPALVNGSWDSHWVYWVGPLAGAALAAAMYRAVWAPPRETTPIPAALQ